jgi:hypothetical protein
VVRTGRNFWASLLVVAILRVIPSVEAAERTPTTPTWIGQARIAGLELDPTMSDRQIEQRLAALLQQNVSVVEADSNMSYYLDDMAFERELALVRRVSTIARRLKLRVVWYFPVLEVLSPKALNSKRSFYKDHPDAVQIGLNGTPNVFYGNKMRVHWVEGDTESAWISPYSSYADLLVERIKMVAAAGVDGIWLDVPLFNDIATEWSDLGPAAAAKFQGDTGMAAPQEVNWQDPAWRRWISWRYDEITNYVRRISRAVKSIASDVAIIVENSTVDHNASTMIGLEGSRFKTDPDIIQVWEIDVLSDETGMTHAEPDDWISLIGMSKFAKAASGSKPSWAFTYGQMPSDGLLVMAEALAAGNHPYETKTPRMSTSVGASYRQRVFSWIKDHDRRLFNSTSAAKVAIYYSPESRDYVDQAEGSGLYTTTKEKDRFWWSDRTADSAHSLTYLADYRGAIKWMVQNHVPFDVIVRPSLEELKRYDALIAPCLAAISDGEARLLDEYVAAGGNLLLTGAAPGMLDELGNEREAPALKSLSHRQQPQTSDETASTRPEGAVVHAPELLGKAYFTSESPGASAEIRSFILRYAPSPIDTDASPNTHIELRTAADELLLHLINPERLWNKQAAKDRNLTINLKMPPGLQTVDVSVTSPEAKTNTARPVPHQTQGDRVTFKLPSAPYAMVIVSTRAKP